MGEYVDGDVFDFGLLMGVWYLLESMRMCLDLKWMFLSELDLDEGELRNFVVIGICMVEMLMDIVCNILYRVDYFLMNLWLFNEILDILG